MKLLKMEGWGAPSRLNVPPQSSSYTQLGALYGLQGPLCSHMSHFLHCFPPSCRIHRNVPICLPVETKEGVKL